MTNHKKESAPPRARIAVHQFLRAPASGLFSLERTFEDVRAALPGDIAATLVVNRRPSRGLLPRLLDAWAARSRRGEVNHILGDVHYVAAFLPPRRTLLTVHDCVSLERLEGWRRWVLWLFWYWWPMKRAAYVSVVSDFTRSSLLSWVRYPEERIVVIPPPLSPEFIYDPPRPHAGWSRLLHVGSRPNKNLERVIEAVAGLDVTLVTIGALSETDRSALDRHGIRFENHEGLDRAELVRQYKLADLLVFPSTYEGFGMPIIEAQAIGRPVVTSDVASMPEAAGGASCLVDPFDVASIRSGICRILEDADYAAQLIEAGLKNAEKYRVETVAAQYAAMYRRISEEAGRREAPEARHQTGQAT